MPTLGSRRRHARKPNPTLSGTAYNVFGIQVGVGITVAVRSSSRGDRGIYYNAIEKSLRRSEKLGWIADHGRLSAVTWRAIQPDARYTWLVPANADEFASIIPIGQRSSDTLDDQNPISIFGTCSSGVKSNRDEVVYDFNAIALADRARVFVDEYNSEVDRFRRSGAGAEVDNFVRYDRIKWSRDLKKDLERGRYAEFDIGKLRTCLYRPFCVRTLFFDRILNEEIYGFDRISPTHEAHEENSLIALTNLGSEKPFMVLAARGMADVHVVGAGAASQCFPFYVYDEDGSNRRENITDWALKQFQDHYADAKIDKWSIFHYVYGVLHHPGYREKFADNLKRELPRIPFAPDFWAFAGAGKKLATLHLDYEKLTPWELEFVETPGVPLSYRVEDKMRLSKDKTKLAVNPSLTLAGLPGEGFEYRLGNRSAVEWVIDQYQVSTDARSGIASDPNREDDPQYIVRLVGQVVRVSVETVGIVKGLPREFSAATDGGEIA